jgi:hypothetical protein
VDRRRHLLGREWSEHDHGAETSDNWPELSAMGRSSLWTEAGRSWWSQDDDKD